MARPGDIHCDAVFEGIGRLAALLGVPEEAVHLGVAGINHLPVLLDLKANGSDGFALLRDWLAWHDPFEFVAEHIAGIRDVFYDRSTMRRMN